MQTWNGWLSDVGTVVTHYAGEFAAHARDVVAEVSGAGDKAEAFFKSHEGPARLACSFAEKVPPLAGAAEKCLGALDELDKALAVYDELKAAAEKAAQAQPAAAPASPDAPAKRKAGKRK